MGNEHIDENVETEKARRERAHQLIDRVRSGAQDSPARAGSPFAELVAEEIEPAS